MKNSRFLSKMPVLAAVLAISFIFTANNSFAQNLQKEAEKSEAQSSGGAALSTGLLSLQPGQKIRVSAVNAGDKNVTLNFGIVYVTDQGKIAGLMMCPDVVVAPGDAAIDVFPHPGGENRTLAYVQIRVREDAKDIEALVPSLEIFNEQTGISTGFLHGSDFTGIRPIFNPPLWSPQD